MNEATQMIRKKMLQGKELSDEELEGLSFGYQYDINTVDVQEGEEHRWLREITNVFSFDEYPSELWAIAWLKGLTEYQDNYSYGQPYRVKKTEKTVTSVVVSYKKI